METGYDRKEKQGWIQKNPVFLIQEELNIQQCLSVIKNIQYEYPLIQTKFEDKDHIGFRKQAVIQVTAHAWTPSSKNKDHLENAPET